MARLPQPGSDNGTWGDILNEYLSQTLKSDGNLKDNVVTNNAIAPNSITATELASNTITAAVIHDDSITEPLLEPAVRAKLNATAPTWTTLSGKPAVVAAGVDAAAAKAALSLAKADVGLGNVDNTSDTAKPVSTAMQAALDAKADDTDIAILGSGSNGQLLAWQSGVPVWGYTSNVVGQATGSGTGVIQLTGDLGGTATSPTVPGLVSKVSGSVNGTPTGLTLWTGTQAQYDAIGSYDSATVYIVTG